MSITLVQSAQHASTSNPTTATFGSSNTAGNFIVVGVEVNFSGASPVLTVTDSHGTYSPAISFLGDASGAGLQIFFLPNIAGGSNTISASFSGASASYINVMAGEFSGVALTSPEDGAGASAFGDSGLPASGNFTVTVGDLIIGLLGTNNVTVGTGYAPVATDTFSLLEYQIAASTTANATGFGSTADWGAQGVAFKIGNFNVSGSVGIAAAGATVSYTGTSSGSTVADASGNFTLSLANGTYTITPTLAGFTFHPASQVVVVNNAAVTGVNFSLPYSQPDCRNYGNFPNLAVNVQGTLTYTTPKTDSRAAGAPVDSRAAGAPVDSRVSKTLNSRTPGTFGPDE